MFLTNFGQISFYYYYCTELDSSCKNEVFCCFLHLKIAYERNIKY